MRDTANEKCYLPRGRNEFPKAGNILRRVQRDKHGASAASEQIAAALRLDLGDTHRAIKTIMAWTGASERSAKNWITGATTPSAEYLIELMAQSEPVLRAVLELAKRGNSPASIQLPRLRQQLLEAIRQIDLAAPPGDVLIHVPAVHLRRN